MSRTTQNGYPLAPETRSAMLPNPDGREATVPKADHRHRAWLLDRGRQPPRLYDRKCAQGRVSTACATASTCAAIFTGRCSTIMNGFMAIRRSSASSRSIARRSSARRNRAPPASWQDRAQGAYRRTFASAERSGCLTPVERQGLPPPAGPAERRLATTASPCSRVREVCAAQSKMTRKFMRPERHARNEPAFFLRIAFALPPPGWRARCRFRSRRHLRPTRRAARRCFSSRAAMCHTRNGKGGKIGPDLTAVMGRKAEARPMLIHRP